MLNKGFTLVELSIVLVIIGLLIGGILVGQSLIDSVKVNRFISEVQQYEIAVKQYKARFRYLPGDDPNAFRYFGDACDSNESSSNPFFHCGGDGDNILQGGSFKEVTFFWHHMSLAGFLEDDYPRSPFNGLQQGVHGPKFSIDPDIFATGWSINSARASLPANSVGTAGFYFGVCFASGCAPGYLDTSLTFATDAKYDDGVPGTGKFIALRGATETRCVTSLSPSLGEYTLDPSSVDEGCTFAFINLNEDVVR